MLQPRPSQCPFIHSALAFRQFEGTLLQRSRQLRIHIEQILTYVNPSKAISGILDLHIHAVYAIIGAKVRPNSFNLCHLPFSAFISLQRFASMNG